MSNTNRRDPIHNLDLLRATAVLFVVVAHFSGLGPDWAQKGALRLHRMGLLGVLIFFVHTSLVLMMSLERLTKELARSPGSRLHTLAATFYIRRVFRIYPLAIFIVLLVTVFRIPADPFFPYTPLAPGQLAANLTLTQNLFKAKDALGPLWSLPWEVQMYMALPFLFLVANSGRFKYFSAVGLATIALNVGGMLSGVRAVRILNYAPCFMSGVFAFMLVRRRMPRLPSWMWPCSLGGMALLYPSAVQLER